MDESNDSEALGWERAGEALRIERDRCSELAMLAKAWKKHFQIEDLCQAISQGTTVEEVQRKILQSIEGRRQ